MKDVFTYVGIIALSLFSFYYTDKVVNIFKGNDPIMLQIMKAEENYNIPCYEGSVSKEGIILGVKGKKVNKIESYNNMKAIGYDDSLLVFEEVECNITKEDNINKYILRGNPNRHAISIIIKVDEGNIEEYNKLAIEKNISFTYLVFDKELSKYKEKLLSINADVVYGGNSPEKLKEYLKFVKKSNKESFCVSSEIDNLNVCSKENVSVIKIKSCFENNVYIESKKKIKSGEFIMLQDEYDNIEELKILINYIKNKGYKILTVSKHLS